VGRSESVSILPHVLVPHGHALMAHEAAHCVRNLTFLSRFRLFFRLETPMNVKWIFFTLYFLQKPSKNYWNSIFISLILYVMSWFVDLHDFSLQNTQNIYGFASFKIKVNYNESSENNIICSSNHWQLF